MGLQTPFNKPIYPSTDDLSGDLATQRGTDPLITQDGSPAVITPYSKPIFDGDGMQETANSESGLPLQPARYTPSEGQPPSTVDIPTVKDRNPGTIDEK